MSLYPAVIDPVPELTVRVARATFRKGNLYLQMRDELGTLSTNADFATLTILKIPDKERNCR